ncbi:MAG: diguanylate cyclase [Planctomycetota bacterium]|nr:diguanylate cyclase [Planctomycetota bacterium]
MRRKQVGGVYLGASTAQFRRAFFGLQFRTTVLLTGVVLAATGLTGVMYVRLSSRLAAAEATRSARELAKALAVAAAANVEQDNRKELLKIAQTMVPEGELVYILFADMSGKLLAGHQKGAGNVERLLNHDGQQLSVETLNRPKLLSDGPAGPRIDIVYPIVKARPNGQTPAEVTIGYVRLGLSLSGAERRLEHTERQVIGLAIAITLLMIPVGYAVVRRLAKPIKRLSVAAQCLSRGQLSTRVPEDRRDEIGDLTKAFNAMAEGLEKSQKQLNKLNAELEDRVAQRTNALQQMAIRDPLTGLYNRRHFNELLNRLYAEAQRYDTDLTCMMIDLDDFKRVNDTLGHLTGDKLLKRVATVIRSTVRKSDVPVRYGGDEFLVLLPRTSPEAAQQMAKRLLNGFRDDISNDSTEPFGTSLSIGLASREQDQPPTAEALVSLADEALYLAKSGGKDRIMVVRPVAVEN